MIFIKSFKASAASEGVFFDNVWVSYAQFLAKKMVIFGEIGYNSTNPKQANDDDIS